MAIEKQKLILIGGVVLGIAAIFMVKMTLDQQNQIAQAQKRREIANMQANQSAVLIAKQDIAEGLPMDPDMLETAIVPNKFVQPRAVTSLDRVSGLITIAPISKGEQVTLNKLTNTNRVQGGSLAGITPAGKRAISISIDSLALLGGMVKPGDYVDVIALLEVPTMGSDGQQSKQIAVLSLFQNVLILAVGQNTGGAAAAESSNTSGSSMVTLALTPQEASFIAFVQEQGRIRLTLRSPADAKMESTVPANWNSLFQYLMPQSNEQKSEDLGPKVEIYRGLNKEEIPLSK